MCVAKVQVQHSMASCAVSLAKLVRGDSQSYCHINGIAPIGSKLLERCASISSEEFSGLGAPCCEFVAHASRTDFQRESCCSIDAVPKGRGKPSRTGQVVPSSYSMR
jgi:hypothetical protein